MSVRAQSGPAGTADAHGRADRGNSGRGQSAESSRKSSPDWAIRVKTNPVVGPRGERDTGGERIGTAA